MTKAKKEVNLKSFGIVQVENGWEVSTRPNCRWYNFEKEEKEPELKTYVFTDLDELLEWIEANI